MKDTNVPVNTMCLNVTDRAYSLQAGGIVHFAEMQPKIKGRVCPIITELAAKIFATVQKALVSTHPLFRRKFLWTDVTGDIFLTLLATDFEVTFEFDLQFFATNLE